MLLLLLAGRLGCLDTGRDLRVQQAGEVTMQALVSGYELIAECEPRHQAPLFEPEYTAEAAQDTESPLHHD